MNQRIAFAAMAMLIAAQVVSTTLSPEAAALVGTYVAANAAAGETFVLTLREDASATLTTTPGAGAPRTETGAWIREGSSVQVAVKGDADSGSATAVTLQVADGALVAAPGETAVARFAGLRFVRSEGSPVETQNK